MTRTTVFQSNRTQAVRLPKAVAFPEGVKEVTIIRDGDRRILAPAGAAWDDFFAEPGVDLPDRAQPATMDRREAF
jgi:antitoxin VapB